jgi:hypothetical protein
VPVCINHNTFSDLLVLKKTEEAPKFKPGYERNHLHNKSTMDWFKRYKKTVIPDYLYLPEQKRRRKDLGA